MSQLLGFSEVVDNAISRSGRVDRIVDITAYANQTLREIQAIAFFRRDLTEDTLTATADPYIWTSPRLLRKIRTVRYPTYDIYPDLILPGKIQQNKDYFYYGGSDYFAFKGAGADASIDVAYYMYFRRFAYYAAALRPASYNEETDEWEYLAAYDVSDEQREVARNLSSCWVLQLYFDTVIEGCLAKLYKAIKDLDRSTASYALYKSLQSDMLKHESFESLAF